KDSSKAGFSTRNVHITEAPAWSHSPEKSKEGKPLDQVAGRMRSIRWQDRRLIVEGTVTTADELPWSLRGEDADHAISTDSRIVTPCPHCRAWISPEREHLKGWQEATSVLEACDKATWICPACGRPISDAERRDANRECRLLHAGQSIERGHVVGDPPATDTLWFRWSQWHNLLLEAADSARDEWLAAQQPEGTEDHESKEKVLAQQVWCRPYQSQLAEAEPLKAETVRRRRDSWERNVLPPDATHCAIGVDCGKWTGWWLMLAGRANGAVHVPAYGAFDVCTSDADEVKSRLMAALSTVIEETFEAGFLQAAEAGGAEQRRLAEQVWIDRGWMKDEVCEIVRRQGDPLRCRYRAAKGFGRSSRAKSPYYAPDKITKARPWVGDRWYAEIDPLDRVVKFNFDADYWKLRIHEWLRTKPAVKGSLTFFRPDSPNEHAKLGHHLCNEQFRREWIPGRGYVDRWVRKGANHWLDCAAMAAAALDYAGYRPAAAPDPAPPDPAIHGAPVPPEDNWYARALAAR
ncbi:MAG TPA: phage terminase large subunit family protein, partial [Lacipirellulaceae bacterium]|nr:phage terminase large subunit family protein [Lacipirellulaceae bacterium]